ncbi:hypothetical protein V5O48_014440 [Marasmius crinis-equi]|uniref:Uncharacterized protein n=1 Tax=Marasmius crinis-equi TaxID=585013 RepID=A0ABR3EXA1_9AGAR
MLVFLGGEPFIPLIVLAGSEHDLGFFAGPLSEMAHNINGSVNPEYLLGLSEDDVDFTAGCSDLDFPSLGLDGSGQEYLDSGEGQEKWNSVGRYYGFSFREMLDYFVAKFEEATRGIRDVGDTVDAMSRMAI